MVTFPDWQVAVETAQVVAGVVQYHPTIPSISITSSSGPSCIRSVRSYCGRASPRSRSKLVSGLLGMVSFQAIAMIVYALSRDELLAVGSAFLIAFTRTAEHGVNYPVHLMGTPHTYGVIGLSLIALIAGFAGAGWYRASGFLLGIAPAVHPSLGAWFMLTMGAAALWHAWRDRAEIRPALRFVLAGCSVTAISPCAVRAVSRNTDNRIAACQQIPDIVCLRLGYTPAASQPLGRRDETHYGVR